MNSCWFYGHEKQRNQKFVLFWRLLINAGDANFCVIYILITCDQNDLETPSRIAVPTKEILTKFEVDKVVEKIHRRWIWGEKVVTSKRNSSPRVLQMVGGTKYK